MQGAVETCVDFEVSIYPSHVLEIAMQDCPTPAHLMTCDFSPQNDHHALLESCTLALLELLPSMECLSPRQAIQEMKAEREGETMIL